MGNLCCCADSNSEDLDDPRQPLNTLDTGANRSNGTNSSSGSHIAASTTSSNPQSNGGTNGNRRGSGKNRPKALSTASVSSSADINLRRYQCVAYLGSGTFADVTLARHVDNNRVFAIKRVSKKVVEQRGFMAQAVTERRLLGKMKHPYLVKLHQAFQNQKYLYMVLSYAPGGDLFSHLHRNPEDGYVDPNSNPRRLPLRDVFFYTWELTLVLRYLHENDCLYRDLKPENILLDGTGHLLLTDFGVSKKIDMDSSERANSFVGTAQYMAPEVLKNDRQTYAVDWWALGCVLFEMVNGRRAFEGNEANIMFKIVGNDVELKPTDFVTSDEDVQSTFDGDFDKARQAMSMLKDFIMGLMEREVSNRIGSTSSMLPDPIAHPFFANAALTADLWRCSKLPRAESIPAKRTREMFERRLFVPPFVPMLIDDDDTQYFPDVARVASAGSPGGSQYSKNPSLLSNSSLAAPNGPATPSRRPSMKQRQVPAEALQLPQNSVHDKLFSDYMMDADGTLSSLCYVPNGMQRMLSSDNFDGTFSSSVTGDGMGLDVDLLSNDGFGSTLTVTTPTHQRVVSRDYNDDRDEKLVGSYTGSHVEGFTYQAFTPGTTGAQLLSAES